MREGAGASTDLLSNQSTPSKSEQPGRNLFAARLVGKLTSDSKQAQYLGLALLAAICIELSIAIFVTGCPSLNSMVWDLSTLLDGGYRVLQGQRPHVDFYSPLGLLTLALVAAGMKMGSSSASAIAYVHVIMLPVLAIWTWILLRSRVPAFWAGLVALWVGVLAVTPRSLGWPPPQVSYSMQYNRWGWALLAIMAVELFIPRRDGRQRATAGLSTGIITGLLLFLKINYFGVAAMAIAIRLAWRGVNWRWLAGAATGCAAVAAAGFAYLNFDFAAFAGDLRLLASVQTLSSRVAYCVQLVFANAIDLWFLASAILIAGFWAYPGNGPWRKQLGPLIAPVSLAALGIVACTANFQKFEIPLIPLAVVVIAEQLRRCQAIGDGASQIGYLAICLIGVGMIGPSLYEDFGTLAAAKGGPSEEEIRQHWPAFDAPPLRALRVSPPVNPVSPGAVLAALRADAITWREEMGEAYPYPLFVNDGVRLLKPHINAQSHVLVMDLSNPFSVALGLIPPRGDALFWHYGRDFDEQHFPPAKKVFREVTHVMVPKAPVHRSATYLLQRIYAGMLATNFHRAAESDLWILYERNTPSSRPSRF